MSTDTIPARFSTVVRRHAGRCAVTDPGRRLTYQQLEEQSLVVARHLRARGTAPGDRVALGLGDEAQAAAAWLGVLRTGALVIPLPAGPGAAAQRAILEDARPRLLLTTRELQGNAALWARDLCPVECLGDADNAPAAPGPEPTHNLSHLVYTSGTTGRPKGVMQTHANVLHNVERYGRLLAITPEDRLAFFGSLALGQGIATLFTALLHGASLHLRPLGAQGLDGLAEWLSLEQITVLNTSVSVLRRIAACLPSPGAVPSLRAIRVGTEELKPADVELVRRHFPPTVTLFNCLGSTETMNYAACAIGPETVLPPGAVPAGHPPDGTRIELLHHSGLESGWGEIVVHSRHLATGYWNNPEATAERFTRASDGTRSFRTGDLGRFTAEGLLLFGGRTDQRVKIRGHAVDPGVIERALSSLPGVREAAVLVRPGPEPRLRAFVASGIPVESLRRELMRHVPEPQVPGEWFPMDHLPLTPAGKVDRAFLASWQPPVSIGTGASGFVPADQREAVVLACWEEVLGRNGAAATDVFQHSGGDSLRAMELFLRLRQRLGMRLHPARFPDGFSLDDLVRAAREPDGGAGELLPVEGAPRLLRMRREGMASPVVLLPGGYGGLQEAELCAGLATHLASHRPVLTLQSGARVPGWRFDPALTGHASGVWNELASAGVHGSVDLVAECVAAPLAVALAAVALPGGITLRRIILLDPWVPPPPLERLRHWLRHVLPGRRPPAAVRTYYRLLKHRPPPRIGRDLHLVTGSGHPDPQRLARYWQARTRGRLHVHALDVPHHTLLRGQTARTAAALQLLLDP